MIELMKRLFIGHSHKWKAVDEITVYGPSKLPVRFEYVMRCEICGNMKVFRA